MQVLGVYAASGALIEFTRSIRVQKSGEVLYIAETGVPYGVFDAQQQKWFLAENLLRGVRTQLKVCEIDLVTSPRLTLVNQ